MIMKKILLSIIVLFVVIDIGAVIYTAYVYATSSYAAHSVVLNSRPANQVKVAFIGDQGLGLASEAVLQLIKDENASIILHQGDFDYTQNPEAWDAQTSHILGKEFPQIATLGNHDVEGNMQAMYQQKIGARLEDNPAIRCTGALGIKATCTYKNIQFVSVAPGIVSDDTEDYASYIRDTFASTTNDWKICLWHKNQRMYQVGDKKSEVPIELYDECRKAGAIIATAHEHSYARSFVLTNVKSPAIIQSTSTLPLSPGQTFIFVSGLGGHSIRPQVLQAPHWASVYSSTQDANFGALFCTFNVHGNTNKAHCYFKDIDGRIADRFDISR
jgi:hypothetical protein